MTPPVPGPCKNTAAKSETPNTESSPKQMTSEIETIVIEDGTDSAPKMRQRYNESNDPYRYRDNVNPEKMDNFAKNKDEVMDDDSLKAFLNLLRIESRQRVIVLASHYQAPKERKPDFNRNLYDGVLKDFEVAIIPIHVPGHPGHWVLGIYRRNESILYFDSLGFKSTYGIVKSKDGTTLALKYVKISQKLKSAVHDITGNPQLNPKIEVVPLDGPEFDRYRQNYTINEQLDNVNCGFHIGLIAEAFLLNNGEVYLENFDIATERTRILDILSGILNNNYGYIPRVACNKPKDGNINPESNTLPMEIDQQPIPRKETEVRNEELKNNNESSAENGILRQRVENLEEIVAQCQEQLKQMQAEKEQLGNQSTSRDVPLDARPKREQINSAQKVQDSSVSRAVMTTDQVSDNVSTQLNGVHTTAVSNASSDITDISVTIPRKIPTLKRAKVPNKQIVSRTLKRPIMPHEPLLDDKLPLSLRGRKQNRHLPGIKRNRLSNSRITMPSEVKTNHRGKNIQFSLLDEFENASDFEAWFATEKKKWKTGCVKNYKQFCTENYVCEYARKKNYNCNMKLRIRKPQDSLKVFVEVTVGRHDHNKIGQVTLSARDKALMLNELDSSPAIIQSKTQTSQDQVKVEVARLDIEEMHNAPVITEFLPETILHPTDLPALTECQPTLTPVINQQSDISKEPTEKQEVAANDDLRRLTRAHDSRKANRRESNKITVQSSSKPKVRLQLTKKRQLDVGPKCAVNGEKRVPRAKAGRKRAFDGKKCYKCKQCQYVTNDRSNFARHMRYHAGVKPYKCQLCNFAAAQQYDLIKHQRTHSGEKPHKCRLCNYATSHQYHLTEHQRIHSGEKPYKCRLCNYAAAHKGNLTMHIRIHTGEKPYECRFCEFASSDISNLSRHMSRKHKSALKIQAANCKKNARRNLLQNSRKND